MTDFAVAHAADGEPRALTEACIALLEGVEGHTLGFLYVTNQMAGVLDGVVALLKAKTGIEDWVGTVGFGVCASGVEYFDRPAMAVLTGRFGADAYRVIGPLLEPGGTAPGEGSEIAAALGVVHGDPRNPHTVDIVAALADARSVYLVGGLTAAETVFPQVAGDIVDGGVSGVLLGGKLQVAFGLTQGCSPIGPAHRVSRGEGQVVATLDDRPAFEVLCEDLGVADGVDPSPWLANIHAALPVESADEGDYLVRNLAGIDPSQGLLAIAGEVIAGDRLMFVRRDAESAAKDLGRMLADLVVRASGTPKAGLYYSCVARGPNLFSDPGHEMIAIEQTFGDIPIAGFFGNGEISNDRVYGYTGVLTLFL